MALISCPECNSKLSSFADVCIHCGYPIAKINQLNKEKEYVIKHIMNDTKNVDKLNFSDELLNDKEFALKIIPKKPLLFKVFSKYIKADKEVCILAVRHDIRNYEFVSSLLRDDEDILNFALNNNDTLLSILYEFNDNLFNDIEFVKKTLMKDSCIFNILPESLKSNDEIVLCLIDNEKADLLNIFKRNKCLCVKRDFALKILERDIRCYAYLSKDLKNNDTIIKFLINNAEDLDEVILINPDLMKHKEFVFKLLDINCDRYWDLSGELQNDLDILNKVIEMPKFKLTKLLKGNPRIADDKELCLKCVAKNKRCINYISLRLKFDDDFAQYLK